MMPRLRARLGWGKAFNFDKVLLSMVGSIGGWFLLVKGYFASKSRGWQCGWEREVVIVIDLQLKESILAKIAGCLSTGSCSYARETGNHKLSSCTVHPVMRNHQVHQRLFQMDRGAFDVQKIKRGLPQNRQRVAQNNGFRRHSPARLPFKLVSTLCDANTFGRGR